MRTHGRQKASPPVPLPARELDRRAHGAGLGLGLAHLVVGIRVGDDPPARLEVNAPCLLYTSDAADE